MFADIYGMVVDYPHEVTLKDRGILVSQINVVLSQINSMLSQIKCKLPQINLNLSQINFPFLVVLDKIMR